MPVIGTGTGAAEPLVVISPVMYAFVVTSREACYVVCGAGNGDSGRHPAKNHRASAANGRVRNAISPRCQAVRQPTMQRTHRDRDGSRKKNTAILLGSLQGRGASRARALIFGRETGQLYAEQRQLALADVDLPDLVAAVLVKHRHDHAAHTILRQQIAERRAPILTGSPPVERRYRGEFVGPQAACSCWLICCPAWCHETSLSSASNTTSICSVCASCCVTPAFAMLRSAWLRKFSTRALTSSVFCWASNSCT